MSPGYHVRMSAVAVDVELREGWQKAWAETLRFAAGFGWRATSRGVATDRGLLPYLGTGRRRLRFDPSEEAGSLAFLALLRFFAPAHVRISPAGSMFAFAEACRYLQRQGLPVDPWFVTERELIVGHVPRLGGSLVYAVEVGPGESLEEVAGEVYLRSTGEVLPVLPRGARPADGDYPFNRVWLLQTTRARKGS